MKHEIGIDQPPYLVEDWPNKYSVFSWLEYVVTVPNPIFLVTTRKANGAANANLHSWGLLVGEIDYQRPAVFTVLEGTQAGRVFVDRRDRPAAALIWSDACYLAGRASDAAFNADLRDLLHTEVMPRTEHLLIYAFADDWRDALDALLLQEGPRRVNRTVFDWDPALFAARHSDWRTRIPEGYAVERIDARTAAQVGGIVELWV